jgi:prepilin-type N-terminal cleavage/methylation domain-containing protein
MSKNDPNTEIPVLLRSATKVLQHSDRKGEAGFTLIEVACALVIILIALLGVVFAFTYAINYNAGNSARTQALAILQQEVEQIRAAKFTSGITDATLTGGTKAAKSVTSPAGNLFTVQIVIDNDPLTAGVQDDTAVPNPTLKEITVTTSLASPSPGWQTAIPATIVLRRVRAN